MPKVTFVNEHRVVEIAGGRLISEVATELGIAFCREHFIGTGFGDTTVWVKGDSGCVSPPGFIERMKGARGWKRFADRARILGDCEIFTQAGLANRLGGSRPLAPVPRPQDDRSLVRTPDEAGTAAFPYGHPSAVGKGNRPAVPRGGTAEAAEGDAPPKAAGAAKAAAAPKAAAAAAAAPAAPAAGGDAAAEKAARIAEKKARQAALKAKAAGGGEAAPAEAAPAEAPAPEAAPAEAAPAEGKAIDPEKAARIAEKKARQAELKARLAAGAAEGEAKPATEPVAEAKPEPAAEAPAEPEAEAKPAMDPAKAARIAEKKARQAELKARLAAGGDPKPEGSEGGS